MTVISTIRSDLAVNPEWRIRIFLIVFRLANASRSAVPIKVILVPMLKIVGLLIGITLPSRTEVGPGLAITHGIGIVIHANSRIGARVQIKQGCTIGIARAGGGAPVIGDDVAIGAGALVLGDISIGAGAQVAAGAIVVDDVPPGALVASPKATVIRPGRNHVD